MLVNNSVHFLIQAKVPHCVKQERIVLIDLPYERTQNAVTSRFRALFPPENELKMVNSRSVIDGEGVSSI